MLIQVISWFNSIKKFLLFWKNLTSMTTQNGHSPHTNSNVHKISCQFYTYAFCVFIAGLKRGDSFGKIPCTSNSIDEAKGKWQRSWVTREGERDTWNLHAKMEELKKETAGNRTKSVPFGGSRKLKWQGMEWKGKRKMSQNVARRSAYSNCRKEN